VKKNNDWKCYNTVFLMAPRYIAAGIATISILGSGIGIGIVFHGFLTAFAKNPTYENKLFTYTLLGFALVEAIALFGLMIVFLLLFAF